MKIEEKISVMTSSDHICNVAFHPNGKIVASSGYGPDIDFWRVSNGKKISVISTDYPCWHPPFAFSFDGNFVAIGNTRQIKLYDLHTKKNIRNFVGICPNFIAFSPDDRILASGNVHDGIIKLWKVNNEIQSWHLKHHIEVDGCAFSPNGKLLGTCGYDETIKLWQVDNRKLIRILRGHTKLVSNIAFSPNGQFLASCSSDKTIKLWEVISGKQILTLLGHHSIVDCVAFHPSGTIIASGSYGTVKIWDLKTGTEICDLNNHSRQVRAVVFSPNGQMLATGDVDGRLRIWKGEFPEIPKVFKNKIIKIIKNSNNLKSGDEQ